MQKKKPHSIWWLCMLPSLLLMAVLVFEWSKDQRETSLLVEALGCLVIGVVCGLFIVKNIAGGSEELAETADAPKVVKPQPVDIAGSLAEDRASTATVSTGTLESLLLSEDIPASTLKTRPDRKSAPEPIALAAPEPIALAAPEPIALAAPEPIALAAPEPIALAAPEPIALAAPEPIALASPEPIALAAPEPIALVAPEPIALASPEPIALAAPEPIALAAPPPTDLPAGNFNFEFAESLPVSREAPPQVSDAVGVTGPDPLPPGPRFEELFDALQTAVPPVSQSVVEAPPSKFIQSSTFKLEIAVSGSENFSPGTSSDSLKLEFAVKQGDDHATSSETRAVVKSLEEKVARIEAMTAKLEARVSGEFDAEELQGIAPREPGDESRPRKLGTRELVRPLPDLQSVAEWLEYALHLEEKHNLDDALKCYDKVVALESGNFIAWYRKAAVLRKKACYEDALYCMNYALRIDTKHSGALTEKGVCMNLMGRHDQAMTWFEKALAGDLDFVPALIGKARCLAAMGKHKEALPIYDKALRNDPGNLDARRGREESAAKAK